MSVIRIVLASIAAVIGIILVIPVCALVLPFWIISTLTRTVSRLIEPRFLTVDKLIEYDSLFGWKPRPNLDTHHLSVDLFHLRIQADGWRGRSTLQESDIVVFGDSFAAGYGVSERHFFANLQLRIKSIGIGGYSMVQELLWMKHMATQLRGKLVVWFIYHGNDLYDNLTPELFGRRKPFVRERGHSGDWEIVSSHLSSELWPIVTKDRMDGLHFIPRLAELCSDTFLAKRAYSACQHLIHMGEQLCNEAGALLVVMTIPDPHQLTPQGQQRLRDLGGNSRSFDPFYPDQQIELACGRFGVPFLAGTSFLDESCYKANDCHWNAKGNRRVADMLARLGDEHLAQSSAPVVKGVSALVQA
jgi:hypothetical protein